MFEGSSRCLYFTSQERLTAAKADLSKADTALCEHGPSTRRILIVTVTVTVNPSTSYQLIHQLISSLRLILGTGVFWDRGSPSASYNTHVFFSFEACCWPKPKVRGPKDGRMVLNVVRVCWSRARQIKQNADAIKSSLEETRAQLQAEHEVRLQPCRAVDSAVPCAQPSPVHPMPMPCC